MRFFYLKLILAVSVFVALISVVRHVEGPLLEGYSFSQKIISQDQKVLRVTLSGDQKYRFRTSLDEVDPDYISSLLKKEDQYFYWHFGFNPISLLKGGLQTYLFGQSRRGGSTITMQLARLLSIEGSHHVWGKIKQILKSVQLEVLYSKKEILEAYLTLAPYGRNIEGLKSAALLYYNKSPSNLTDDEISHLLQLPQNPNSISLKRPILKVPFRAPHFVDRILEFRDASDILQTTLHYGLQSRIEGLVKAHLLQSRSVGVNNAAVLIQRISSGEVLAYVGSNDYFSKEFPGQVNGVKGRRSPGSVLKPFLFALALEQGIIHPETLLKDLPQSFGLFDPENFDRAFMGPISATTALVDSRNIPAVELLKKTSGFLTMLRAFGIEDMQSDETYGLGAAIGGVEVTLEDVSALYQQLAYMTVSSKMIFANAPILKKDYGQLAPFVSKESRFVASNMLLNNRLNASLDRYRKATPQVAWKTGTSHGFRDAWTAGLFDDFVISVWIGDFEGKTNPAFRGRDLAAPLALSIVDLISKMNLKAKPKLMSKSMFDHEPSWTEPVGLNLTQVDVCSKSGGLAKPECPKRKKTFFIPGVSPIHDCAIHKKVDSILVEEWPSDMLSLFEKAGLFLKSNQRPAGSATQTSQGSPNYSGGEQGLQIVLPRSQIVQISSHQNPRPVLMKATYRNLKEKLDWFIDGEFIGTTHPEGTLKWTPYIGQYQLQVVASDGSVDSQTIKVEVVQ